MILSYFLPQNFCFSGKLSRPNAYKRNELIERIEETLNTDRTRELTDTRAATTQVSSIEVIDRTPPLGEFLMTAQVSYSFTKGAV